MLSPTGSNGVEQLGQELLLQDSAGCSTMSDAPASPRAFSMDDIAASEEVSARTEAGIALRLALPVSAAAVLWFSASLISTAMIGRVGSLELSAVVLARSIFHITGLSV